MQAIWARTLPMYCVAPANKTPRSAGGGLDHVRSLWPHLTHCLRLKLALQAHLGQSVGEGWEVEGGRTELDVFPSTRVWLDPAQGRVDHREALVLLLFAR